MISSCTVGFFLSIILYLVCFVLSIRHPPNSFSLCKWKEPQTLHFDQMTVLINGYSEYRIPLLSSIAATYSASKSVSQVFILWSNPSTAHETLEQLSHNLTVHFTSNAPISLLRQPSSSLNYRFYPQEIISTHGVLICDDDIEPDLGSIDFAFRVWHSNPDRLVGFFARSHEYDLDERTWIYTMKKNKYSIILTKFMILKYEYLVKYSCHSSEEMTKLRAVVDEMQNCEDILMNFVVADIIDAGPLLVGAERVRDWGDARNEGLLRVREREVGLSSRKGEHRKRRGECIREFHRILGRMPLRHNYGKVVNAVGEQGLCEKGGSIVFCDE